MASRPSGSISSQLESEPGAIKLSRFAEIMNVCYMTTYRWVRNSGLPATKIAGTYWLDPADAAAWWRDQSTIKKPPVPIVRNGRIKRGKRA